jgi:P27 family predicted phage terminase small subunit
MAEVLPIRPAREAVFDATPPEPPESLSEESARIWRDVVGQWVLGPDGLPLLQLACESWDRYRSAADLIDAEGLVIATERDSMKTHPAHQAARDWLDRFRQLFRQLKLEPPEIA